MSEKNNVAVSVRELVVELLDDERKSREIRYGSFDIMTGDFMLIKGRNGSGKSTFLRLFHLQGQNYFRVKSGNIFFTDEAFPKISIHKYSPAELTHLNCAISFIGQEERFLSSDSAYSYIYNACRLALSYDKSLTASDMRDRLVAVDGLIFDYYEKYLQKSFECKNYKTFKNKNVRGWSGGQQKMINVLAGIIKARICGLKLVVMDEPLNNLDGRNKDILNKLIAELRQGDVAVVAITHCQIFGGVNKVMNITEDEDGIHIASVIDFEEPAHLECLEAYN